MKFSKIFLSLSALCFSLGAGAQYQSAYNRLFETDAAAEMRSTVEYLSSEDLEGRGAGSKGELEAAAFLTSELRTAGVDVLSGDSGDVFGMKLASGDTLVSRNVVGFISGYDRNLKNEYIVIGARLDGPGMRILNRDGQTLNQICPGANGNASGVAVLIRLARMLKTNSVLLRRSVLLVGFGASLQQNAGAWYFLNRSFPDVPKISAMVNLDMVGTPSSGFYAYCASNPDLTQVLTTLRETLQPIQPQIVTREPVASDHRAFYEKQIPSVFFTTGMYPEYNTPRDDSSVPEYDAMERVCEYVYNFVLSIVNGPRIVFDPGEQLESGQNKSAPVPWYECDYKPSFLGSPDPSVFLQKWVYVYLRYPEQCVREGIQGRVLVDFIISEKGKVEDVRVLKGVDPRLDEEAVRVVSASPDWKPGRLRGKKVRTEMSMYIEFRLDRKK